MNITVIITILNDYRIIQTLKSLFTQTLPPAEILIAYGGADPQLWTLLNEWTRKFPALVRLEQIPGTVAKTRKTAVKIATGDIIAFIDTDEIAPPQWLKLLTTPIIQNRADFTGGPTRPKEREKSRIERYLNIRDAKLYEHLKIEMLPMGNSAWRATIFKNIEFDESLCYGGEDYDINLKALKAGYRGMFVPEAWVYHDQSSINTLRKYVKKRYNYLKNTARVYKKHKVLNKNVKYSLKATLSFTTPIDILDLILKPLAYLVVLFESSQR